MVFNKKPAVFEAHGQTLNYARNSLYLFGRDNPFRLGVIKSIAHPWFDRLILVLIVLNSVVLALTDWSRIETNPSSSDVGQPLADGSWRNTLLYESEPVFTSFYALECVLKVIAQGFFLGQGSYLRDWWNILDFVVVTSALLGSIPGMPRMGAVRGLRVLRPLRSLKALPGLQKLVLGMLVSLPQLVSVVFLLLFIFAAFGVFSIQLFAGKQHARCRITPYPVSNDFEVGMNYTEHRCLEVSNFDVEEDEPSWTRSSSPWSTSRECWWPLDTQNERLCAFDSSYGNHKCEHDPQYMNETEFRWCGSNYDALGNPRFTGGVTHGVERSAAELMKSATFVESLNWGYTTFDDFGAAFLTIFQSITLEAWTDILYQVKDCSLPALGDIFFIVLILWGSLFTLNLLLAVLEEGFGKESKDREEKADQRPLPTSERVDLEAVEGVEAVEAAAAAATADEKLETKDFPARHSSDEEKETDGRKVSGKDELTEFPRWRLELSRVIDSSRFKLMITAMIILNTIVLAIDHHPMDAELSSYLDAFNFAFTLCFAIEMILKLMALGPRGYSKERLNVFDALLVISSVVELIVSPPGILTGHATDHSSGGLFALRTFRVLRVLKLAREWQSMRELLATLSRTLVDVGYFALLLVLFMYIYALMGLQFFANRLRFDEFGGVVGIGEEGYEDADVPRANFDTLSNSFTTIFEILTGDSWNRIMYDARRATGWVSVLFFISVIVLGMMILMNLFLAILLSNFSHTGWESADNRVKAGDSGTLGPSSDGELDHTSITSGVDPVDDAGASSPARTGPCDAGTQLSRTAPCIGESRQEGGEENGEDVAATAAMERGDHGGEGHASGVARTGILGGVGRRGKRAGTAFVEYWVSAIRGVRVPDDLHGRALFLLGPKNPIRRGCAAVVSTPGFDHLVLLLIAVSSLSLAWDTPLINPNSAMATFLERVEVITTSLFATEMVLKVCARGYLFLPGAYLRNSWNIIDFVVVVTSVVELATDGAGHFPSLKSIRTLRALRPLRVINRAPGLKLVLNSLFASIPDVLNVVALCVLFFLIFAILGVTYFKGILMSCQGDGFDALPNEVALFLEKPVAWSAMSTEQQTWFGPTQNMTDSFSESVGDRGFWSAFDCATINSGWPEFAACCSEWPSSPTEAPTSFQVCNCLGLEWDKTIPEQFDNAAQALLTFFELSTISGWASIMYAAVDATGEDMQPIRDAHMGRVWFFILFMLFGALLIMNLFVGVVIENFKKMKAMAEGNGVLVTEEQQAWIKTQMIMHRFRPMKRLSPPGDVLGDKCFRLVQHKWFELTVMICIMLNTLIMAMQYFGQGDLYTRVLDGANLAFYLMFLLEAIIKIIALRWKYFKDSWNRFDLFVVVGSTLGLVMLWSMGTSYGSVAMVIRIFRIGRVLRLIRGLESMAKLFNTLLLTLPSLGNVGGLLFLLLFVYASMGVQLFATVAFEGAVNHQANFQTFWGAMMLLLRFSTGDNWNGFMYDMAADRPGCESEPEYDPDVCGFTDHANCIPINGCGTWAIFPYMITFTIAVTYVFMNLFIGITLDGFDEASNESTAVITQEDFMKFAQHWEKYDPKATCMISVQVLREFLQTLFAPWGFGEGHQASDREMLAKIRRLKLRIFSNNEVHFKDVLLALSEEVHRTNAEQSGATIDLPQAYQTKLAKRKNAAKLKGVDYMVNPVSREDVRFEHIMATELIQKSARTFLERRRTEGDVSSAAPYHGGSRFADIVIAARQTLRLPSSPARSVSESESESESDSGLEDSEKIRPSRARSVPLSSSSAYGVEQPTSQGHEEVKGTVNVEAEQHFQREWRRDSE